MYSESFFITQNIGNNALSYDARKKSGSITQLYVPSLQRINSIDEVHLLDSSRSSKYITFEDYGFDDNLSTCYGLKNFYELDSPLGKNISWKIPKVYLFDNHNHALYFWYLAKHNWDIRDWSTLYHIDEHADYRDPWEYISTSDVNNLEKVFQYTNFSKINVWNYIIPAEKQWLISETIQIRSSADLENYQLNTPILQKKSLGGRVILNIDLDFFQPDLNFIDYDQKKKVIYDIMKYADVVTVATSPFFIDQKLALEVFKDLFYK